MNDLEYIRTRYQVPARPGAPVTYYGEKDGRPRPGRVVGTSGPHVLIRLDGETTAHPYHPTWCLIWPEENGPATRVPQFEGRPAPDWLISLGLHDPQWSGV